MKMQDVKIDLDELRKFKKRNAIERLKFIDFLVKYMKKQDDKEWSEQQRTLIDSQIKRD